MGFDSRHIQTAVAGRPESDEPLICPIDAVELDAFREEHAGETLWCGLLLGGCGRRLTTRRCTTRICHFAHLPGEALECARRAGGAGTGSADHLYVKATTVGWLQQEGHRPTYRLIKSREDAPVASIVEIALAHSRLRVHMDLNVPPDWETEKPGELLLGPRVPVDPVRLRERGFVHRIRFETAGSSRRIRVGTQVPESGTDWFEADECTITADGQLQTPLSARLSATAPPPPAHPAPPIREAPEAVAVTEPPQVEERVPARIGTLVRRLNTAVRSGQALAAQRLCQVAESEQSRCTGTALHQLEAATADARGWLEQQDRLRGTLTRQLDEAVRRGNVPAVRDLQRQLHKLLKGASAPTEAESGVLDAAARLLSPYPAPQPRSQKERQDRSGALESGRGGAGSRERREAAVKVRWILGRLNSRRPSRSERNRLAGQLRKAVNEAGDALSAAEREEAASWGSPREAAKGREPGQGTRSGPRQERDRGRKREPRNAAARGAKPGKPSLSPQALESAAAAVRGALKKHARERTTPSWSRLRSQLGAALPRMSSEERVELLVLVDRSTPPDKALLSSLLAAGDPDLARDFRRAAEKLGLELPEEEQDLRDVLVADAEKAQTDWTL